MIEAKELKVGYDTKVVIESCSINIEKGKILSIIGPNGSGKSTLLKTISRLIKPKNGIVYLKGKNICNMSNKDIAKEMAVVSQENSMPSDFTVEDLVAYGRFPHKKWYEVKSNKDKEIIDWALFKTRLSHMSKRKVATLSGGERQRAWIAMALAQKPEVLLLDEPTTYLDICHQLELMELIKKLNNELNITVVMVLHDLNQASKYSHKICVLKEGKIVKEGVPEEILTEKLIRDVYNVKSKILKDDSTGKLSILPLSVAVSS